MKTGQDRKGEEMYDKMRLMSVCCLLFAVCTCLYGAGEVTGVRDLPECYVADANVAVSLNLDVDEVSGPNGVIVRENVPAGWTITSATPSYKTWSPGTGEIKWLFFGTEVSDTGMDIVYEVAVPAGETGDKTFSGEILYNDPNTGELLTEVMGEDTALSKCVRTLKITSTTGGSVTPGVGDHDYDQGEKPTITATPAADYHFVEWTGSAVTAGKVADPNSATTTVTMDADYAVQANFERDPPPPPGGGCSISPDSKDGIVSFLLPYVAFAIVLLAMSVAQVRRRARKNP